MICHTVRSELKESSKNASVTRSITPSCPCLQQFNQLQGRIGPQRQTEVDVCSWRMTRGSCSCCCASWWRYLEGIGMLVEMEDGHPLAQGPPHCACLRLGAERVY